MKCEICGKELNSLEVNMFDADGGDDWCDVDVDEESGVAYMSVLTCWTGYELSEEEQVDTIRCPHCHKYPFVNRFVDACTYVNVLMYPKSPWAERKE